MELDLSGIDSLLNPAIPQSQNAKTPELNLTGVDEILSKASPPSLDKIIFQPENSDWSLGRLSSIEDFFIKEFGKPLPVSTVGQGKIHNKWSYDHKASADIGINPNSKEGKRLVAYLKQNNIPFLAFTKAISGVSTGPHIHIGKPSHKIGKDFIEEQDDLELDLTGLEEVLSPNLTSVDTVGTGQQELDITGVGNVQAPLDLTFALDPKKINFQRTTEKVPAILEWATRYNKPAILTNNPNEVGPIVRTTFDNPKNEKPSVKQLTDAWLEAWNPEYKILNDKFREETGGLNIALVDSRKNYNFLPNNKIEVLSRPTRGIQALFEAYKNGGLREFNATNHLINQQLADSYNEQLQIQENIKEYEKKHPYLSAFESGVQGTAQQITQLSNNIKYLGKAVATGNFYGYDSTEYLDLINKEIEEQETIAELGGTIYNPPSFAGKVVAGAAQGLTSLPLYVAAAHVNPAALPVMTYVENLHRGNRSAALAALPMAILVGSGRGLGKFTDISPAGSSAPFRRVPKVKGKFTREDLSLFQETLVKGESISTAQLTPFERQLIHRGANALSLQFPQEGQDWSDVAANIVVGLGFPVGKSPGKVRLPEFVPTPPKPKIPLQLGEARIDVPIVKPITMIGAEGDILVGGETINLDLDTANLNLLELKRALEEKTYRVEGDDLKTVLQKQQAIKNAIDVLEKAIPDSTKEFFAQNEKVIREALRTNYEARVGKENFIKRREESLKPNDVKIVEPETPKVGNLKQTTKEVFAGKAGDENVFTSQEKAHEILKDFFKITTQGTLKSSLLPYGDVLAKKAQDLSYLSAFYVEDFYRRGVVPTVDLVRNKIRESIGDFGKYISDDQAKKMFNDGLDFYNSNVADPFFSKMKLDVTEKLPNKFTVEQARNIINLHSNESEWTTGLKEFLDSNEGKKISKQDLIDVIQRGQVRVEESVATDELPLERVKLSEEITKVRDEMYAEGRKLNQQFPEYEAAIDYFTFGKQTGTENLTKKWPDELAEGLHNVLTLREKFRTLQDQFIALPKLETTKYSLQAYTHEKLELPGAKNSKEVKLISTLEPSIERVNNKLLDLDRQLELARQNNDLSEISRLANLIGNVEKTAHKEARIFYTSAHWNEPNVVAHYRSNDRVTTDNQRVYFGEEFQSDWTHDIREQGINYKSNPELAISHAKGMGYAVAREADGYYIRINGERTSETEKTEALAWKSYFYGHSGVEPMPFMGHNWKELVLKRFLRDAAIAKDENGNYKYDGVGWTTARQQLERYGGILEGKEFEWKKNSDGTYSFGLITPEATQGNYIHELQQISLERFAELTTPEAAQHVRDQEAKTVSELQPNSISTEPRIKGQFSLKEAVELRSREGTYADYDVAYKNIVSKIGKRFGAKYSEKEIPTQYIREEPQKGRDGLWYLLNRSLGSVNEQGFSTREEAINNTKNFIKSEKIHYIEITPSMRQSLEKEGLPLFGTGGLDPLKNPEVGIRNILTTREAFNQHRDSLVKSLEEIVSKIELTQDERAKYEQAILDANKEDLENMQLLIEAKKGTVFNSGLSPDAFIDQTKLLYRGIQDFAEFTKVLVERFGEQVKPFLQDLWMQVKDIAKAFNEDERGFLNLQFKRMQTDAEKKYRASKKSTFYYDWYSVHRGIMLAQRDPRAGIVYDTIRLGQRDKNSFEHNVLTDLRSANKAAKKGIEQPVAETIFIGNENQRLFTNAELAAGDASVGRPALNPDQIQAYNDAYKAEHRNLDKRLQQVLFGYRERADRLNTRLASTTPGTPAHTTILTNLLNVADAMKKVTNHYQHLKDTGYISLKRKGPIAAFVQDPAFPVGDKRGEVYRQFDSIKEAGDWVKEQERLLSANPADSNIYDINNSQRLREAAARLTPAQFEDLIDSSGVNSRSPEIEQLRDEIYSRFPSKGYELKRDYVRGYDRSWQFVLESIADQTESYANSFYSRVAGEYAIKALEATGLQADNVELYKVLQKYIDHEISSPERTKSSRFFTGVRKGVYLFQLGFDINQLYLNAIAQPITQTYSYFARVSHNGKMLGPLEAEKYWIEAWGLAGKVARKSVTGKGTVPVEFENIRNQLIAEGVITPEFNKSLLESEAEKGVSSKLEAKSIRREIEHWAGVFMRAGEKTTRTHVAAEAYLVGKEKFGLSGQDLINFMVRSIDATQTNPSRAEAPLLIRGSQNTGEIRKLLYQFNAFNHMWIENLALNVKSDFQNRRISATSRHLIPLAIMGGIAGLPLSGIAAGLYTLITNKDPKDEFHKYVNNFPLLERLALYGVTGSATLSNKLTPTVPFTDNIKIEDKFSDTLTETFSTSAIPAFSTAGQIAKGFDDLFEKEYLRAAGSLAPIKPFRNAATVLRYSNEGVKTRKGKTIIPKNKVTSSQLFFQGLGIPPSPVTEYYEKTNRIKRTKTAKKLRKILL